VIDKHPRQIPDDSRASSPARRQQENSAGEDWHESIAWNVALNGQAVANRQPIPPLYGRGPSTDVPCHPHTMPPHIPVLLGQGKAFHPYLEYKVNHPSTPDGHGRNQGCEIR